MKQGALIMILLSTTICLAGCDEPDPTTGTLYEIEYDHQVNCDVLSWGQSVVEDAFSQANTACDFRYDDTNLPNRWVRLDSLYEYYIAHVKRDTSGEVMHPAYLCGIERVRDSVGNPLDQYWGFTYYPPEPRVGCSFVVVGNPSLPFDCRVKVIIHELGHQRCIVTHLCLNDTTMHPAHNDSACVMGKGETAICTGKNLCSQPQFCAVCRSAIANVSW